MEHIGDILQRTMDELWKKERRYKMLTFNISFEVKWMIKALELFPEHTYVVSVDNDVYNASSYILLASSEFDQAPQSQQIPKIIVEIDYLNEKVTLLDQVYEDGKFKTKEFKKENYAVPEQKTRKMFKE